MLTSRPPDRSKENLLRVLLKLALPVMAIQFLQTGYQLTDAYWVGKLGGNAVAAVSVNFPINFVVLALGSGFAIAGSILVAQFAGAKKKDMVDHVATQTLFMILIVSFFLATIAYLAAPKILLLLGIGPDIFADSLVFLRISLLGIPASFVFIMFQGVMRGIKRVKIPLLINVVTLLLNFALDPLFIYGWEPIGAHGVAGAAIATFITQMLSAVAGLYILAGGYQGIQLKWKEMRPDWPLIRKSFKLGFPSSIEFSARSLALSTMVFLVTAYGTQTLAVYGIGVRLLSLIVIPAMGMSQATSTLVGQSMGAGKIEDAAHITRLATWICFGLLSSIGVICYFFAPVIANFFVQHEPTVKDGSVVFIHIGAFFFGFMGIQAVLGGAFKGAGLTTRSMLLSIINGWLIQIPAAIVLSRLFHWGYIGIWISSPLSNVVASLIAVFWYRRGDWKHKKLLAEI